MSLASGLDHLKKGSIVVLPVGQQRRGTLKHCDGKANADGSLLETLTVLRTRTGLCS